MRLCDNGLYVLEHLKNFGFPMKIAFLADLNELIDVLSILCALFLVTNEKYNGVLIEKSKWENFHQILHVAQHIVCRGYEKYSCRPSLKALIERMIILIKLIVTVTDH